MQLDDVAIDRILTIVQLLAQGADDKRLSPNRVHALNRTSRRLFSTTATSLFASFSQG